MTLASLTTQEREVVRRAMEGAVRYFDIDLETRLGVSEDTMRALLCAWPTVDDTSDSSDACLAINNALNDLLHGIGISDQEAIEITGVGRTEMYRIYKKWARCRGWTSTGVR